MLYFNSSKVRLKVRRVFNSEFEYLHFNSSKVRLKVSTAVYSDVYEAHFNSSKVRLKASKIEKEKFEELISIPLRCD